MRCGPNFDGVRLPPLDIDFSRPRDLLGGRLARRAALDWLSGLVRTWHLCEAEHLGAQGELPTGVAKSH
jgi:hypothetical protein